MSRISWGAPFLGDLVLAFHNLEMAVHQGQDLAATRGKAIDFPWWTVRRFLEAASSDETLQARWMTRDEYMNELVAGRMESPGKATIARYMIEEWLGHDLP